MNKKVFVIGSIVIAALVIFGLVGQFIFNTVKKDDSDVKIVEYDKNKIEKIDKKVSDNRKEILDKNSCPEINEVKNFSDLDCISVAIVEKQIELRTIQSLKESHDVNYSDQDVLDYYTKQSNKSKNKLRSKVDVGSVSNTWIDLVGIENYARDKEMDYISNIIINKETNNIINGMDENEKSKVIDEGSALWESLGVKKEEANNKALRDYAYNIASENFNAEVEALKYHHLIGIFKEVQPDLYNSLPNEKMKDDYTPDVEIPEQ